ncbi:MAG: hypothetical protein MAG581_00273 [Deltaproteobacteria bacterium]|nr:hypothetical protein [Deltaproteobacteria bacterium]
MQRTLQGCLTLNLLKTPDTPSGPTPPRRNVHTSTVSTPVWRDRREGKPVPGPVRYRTCRGRSAAVFPKAWPGSVLVRTVLLPVKCHASWHSFSSDSTFSTTISLHSSGGNAEVSSYIYFTSIAQMYTVVVENLAKCTINKASIPSFVCGFPTNQKNHLFKY